MKIILKVWEAVGIFMPVNIWVMCNEVNVDRQMH